MPKVIINAKQANYFEKGGQATYNDFSSSDEKKLRQIIESIINSNDDDKIQKSIKDADALLIGKNKSDCKKIVDDLVKENIDSEEEKNSFLQKIEQFTLGVNASLFANLLCEVIKTLVISS